MVSKAGFNISILTRGVMFSCSPFSTESCSPNFDQGGTSHPQCLCTASCLLFAKTRDSSFKAAAQKRPTFTETITIANRRGFGRVKKPRAFHTDNKTYSMHCASRNQDFFSVVQREKLSGFTGIWHPKPVADDTTEDWLCEMQQAGRKPKVQQKRPDAPNHTEANHHSGKPNQGKRSLEKVVANTWRSNSGTWVLPEK